MAVCRGFRVIHQRFPGGRGQRMWRTADYGEGEGINRTFTNQNIQVQNTKYFAFQRHMFTNGRIVLRKQHAKHKIFSVSDSYAQYAQDVRERGVGCLPYGRCWTGGAPKSQFLVGRI